MLSTNRRALLGILDDQPTVFETSDYSAACEVLSPPPAASAQSFSHEIDSSPMNMRASIEAFQRNMPHLSISGVAEGGGNQRILQRISELQTEISQSTNLSLGDDISQQMAILQNQVLKLAVQSAGAPAPTKTDSAPSSFVAIESRLGSLEKTIGCPESVCMYPDLWSAVTELHRRVDLMNPEAQLVIKSQLEQLESEMIKVCCVFTKFIESRVVTQL